ncbi:NMDA receptor-regulated protein 1-domain-containing protein [Polychytrium aggregatum]|uniref:NMDA receptor-regulated protein 1-domain-containing protein n=1 Tax=Polychytrium aggregatum TaxID=110093 RepID=UPI0022FF13A3|nr:NMDA receptor-regulated protein 1-domain-containing protein [Polychytrium aggregatum]KAI9202793.1 NMDA receptor-regulated protein 1-domain-containing protein [Polychytrium aggregatum]
MSTGSVQRTGRELPAKESALFKSILKFYEHKQYKKGIKVAEQILKKFPNHGETLAMKGLFCGHLDRKEDAHQFIKKGIVADMTSHICWHVYGLFYRGEKNYEEASKCYIQALKFDKENIQILRDYSLLQLQMRNYETLKDSRLSLIQLRSSNRLFWVGLAIAYHLLGNYDRAIDVLTTYEQCDAGAIEGPLAAFEISELLLYRNSLIEASGDLQRAYDDLEDIKRRVVDKQSWKQAKGRLTMNLGYETACQQVYEDLVRSNPDCVQYIIGYQGSFGWSTVADDNIEEVLQFYEKLSNAYPRSNTLKRIPLQYATGDRFAQLMDVYLQNNFRKGVPSLFVSLKDCLKDAKKLRAIEDLVNGYKDSLERTGRFGAEGEKEPPSTLLWVLYFLAQFYDKQGQANTALKHIEAAIKHTPTSVELHMTRARIYKHAGDNLSAAKFMEEARELDLQDRFVNSKATKYWLRADNIAQAEKTAGYFTKHDAPDPVSDLTDMQCFWFLVESAKSYVRLNKPGMALKRLNLVEKIFNDIYDDQFDFHSYCLRKMTLRSYTEFLFLEDKLKSHPFFFQAAVVATKLLINLHDKPKGLGDIDMEEYANMSASDRKKAQRKARKAELKSAAEGNVTPAAGATAVTVAAGSSSKKKPVDEDPSGEKLLNSNDFLGDSLKFLRPLLELSPTRIESQYLGAEVYIRKKKYLLALKCIKAGLAIDPRDSNLHKAIVRFIRDVRNPENEADAAVAALIDEELEAIIPGAFGDVVKYNDRFCEQNALSLAHVLAASEIGSVLGSAHSKAQGAKQVKEAFMKDGCEFTLETAVAAYAFVKKNSDSAAIEAVQAKCKQSFPLAQASSFA